jgi:tetratricopeptide (TPR) repeat protein
MRPDQFMFVRENVPLTLQFAGRLPRSGYRLSLKYEKRGIVSGELPAYSGDRPWSIFAAPGAKAANPVCAVFYDKARAILEATDEAQVSTLVKTLGTLPPEGAGCDELRAPFRALLDEALPLVDVEPLSPLERVQIVLERLDASGQPAKRWFFQMVTQGFPPVAFSASTEEEWLVTETVRDIAALAFFARGVTLVDPKVTLAKVTDRPGAYSLEITEVPDAPPLRDSLVIDDHLWSPRVYEGVATRLLERLGVRARRTDTPTESALLVLTDARASVLETENQRVSSWLAASPASPEPHERAALILGAFGMREAAGRFSDTRRTLSAMTSHLALGHALRRGRPPGIEGEYAALLLETLAGRPRPALERLRQREAKKGGAAEQVWNNALFIRNSLDWRRVKEPERARLLERREYLRALVACFDDSRGLEFLDHAPQEAVADWSRLLLQSQSFGVESAHRFADSAVATELVEMSQLWPGSNTSLTPASAAALLAEATQRKEPRLGVDTRPMVITRQTWARFYERHLAAAAAEEYRALRQTLGLKDAAAESRRQIAESLSRLALAPVLDLQWTLTDVSASFKDDVGRPGGPDVSAPCEKLVPVVKDRPDLFTVPVWTSVKKVCSRTAYAPQFPAPTSWFDPVFPLGTAYEGDVRLHESSIASNAKAEELQVALRLSVFGPSVLGATLYRTEQRDVTSSDYAAAFSAVAEYSAEALRQWVWIAKKAGPSDLVPVREKLCKLDPRECLALGELLALLGRDDEAAAAYERAVEHSRDRVAVSNGMGWLIDYYLARGREDLAMARATMAADVYSESGLGNKGRLLERLGRTSEAKDYYHRIAERYDVKWWQDCFEMRQAQRGPARDPEDAVRATRDIFPEGLRKVSVSELTGLPARNEAFPAFAPGGVPDELQKGGIGERDFIVAIDGYRVASWEQYRCVETFDDSPQATVIVYRHPKYAEVTGSIRRQKRWQPLSGRP